MGKRSVSFVARDGETKNRLSLSVRVTMSDSKYHENCYHLKASTIMFQYSSTLLDRSIQKVKPLAEWSDRLLRDTTRPFLTFLEKKSNIYTIFLAFSTQIKISH
jgi:hypothetical protein